MDESFGVIWEDFTRVVQPGEVVCGIENDIHPAETEEFTGIAEQVSEEGVKTSEIDAENGGSVVRDVYFSDGNVLVMNETTEPTYQEQLMEWEMTEEIFTEQCGDGWAEEIVVGSEEVVGTEEPSLEDCDISLPTDQDEYTAVRPYPCDFSNQRFREKDELMNHMVVHQPDRVQTKHGKGLPPNTCMLFGRTYKNERTLLKHSWENSEEKNFTCSKCAKTFHDKARLKRHMLSHRNKLVTCDVCGEEFPEGRSLMNHRHSRSNVSGKQFPCKECGKTFGSLSSQQIHIRRHTGERPYGCRFCRKAFADGGTLRKHERIHTGEKPYVCAVCPRAFNQRVVLRNHIMSHHSGPHPKYINSMTPYCCSVCSNMFATSQDLILHLIHHCDMNTAMKRQPQVGPRKYKRRRKLTPHELELISGRIEDEEQEQSEDSGDNYTDSGEQRERRKRYARKQQKKTTSPTSLKEPIAESYTDLINSCYSAIERINTLVNSKSSILKVKTSKRMIPDQTVPSRPKMIHTQKTRVPVETGEDGRVRYQTRTLVTRTQPIIPKTK